MFDKIRVLFFVIVICSISFVLSAFAATPKPAPASYKQVTFNAEKLSQEVAQVISWLLSDSASYVSGAVIPVAGAR